MKKILITGVSGLLGSNLAFCWRDQYEILSIYHRHPIALQGIKTQPLDLADSKKVNVLLKEFNPDVIVHAAAMADVDQCEMQPQSAYRANVSVTRNLVDAIDEKAKFVYISTDLVYDGSRGGYTEADPVSLINVYAKTKYEGEQIALQRPNTLIARTNFFGWNVQDKMCFAERVIQEAKLRTIKGFTDSFFSSIYTFDFSRLLNLAIENELQGIYHLASSSSLSRFDFADLLVQKLGYENGLIQRSSIKEFVFKAPRAPNLSLQTRKLSEALRIQIPTSEECIEHFVQDYRRGISKTLRTDHY